MFVTGHGQTMSVGQHEVSHTPRTHSEHSEMTLGDCWWGISVLTYTLPCWHTLFHLWSNCSVQIAHGLALVRSQTLGLVLFLKKWKLTVIVEACVYSFHSISPSPLQCLPIHYVDLPQCVVSKFITVCSVSSSRCAVWELITVCSMWAYHGCSVWTHYVV